MIIGVHIRHSDGFDPSEILDIYAYNCIKSQLRQFFAEYKLDNNGVYILNRPNAAHNIKVLRPCVILMATDRKHEISLWTNKTHHTLLGGSKIVFHRIFLFVDNRVYVSL